MTFSIRVSGAPEAAVAEQLPVLIGDLVASSLTNLDSTLWGPDAESEASIRLGWIQPVSVSRPLVAEIVALRDELNAKGVDRFVLGGMGGSSLAPEVITRTAGVEGAAFGVRVNAVSPSIAMHAFLAKVTTDELLEELSSREAFGRAAEPWEVANVIVFLASGYASYLTGEVLSVSSQHP